MIVNLLVAALAAAACAYDLYEDPQTLPNRRTMVQLFEWKFTDIAKECEDFLQYYGYGAVQISPPTEHIWHVQNNDIPWFLRYQPVSYELRTRSGTGSEFINMVHRCNNVGVRIIVEVVFNNMVPIGEKKGVNGIGSSGDCDFDGTAGVETFPCIGYTVNSTNDWRCSHSYTADDTPANKRNCRVVGLIDLDQSNTFVRGKIIEYMDDLITIGVAGFRFESAQHMWLSDLKAILAQVRNLRVDIFGENQRPFVLDAFTTDLINGTEYIDIGQYSPREYGMVLTQAARKQNRDFSDMERFGERYEYDFLRSIDVLGSLDNVDTQRSGAVLRFKDGDLYAMTVGFMLGWGYGYPRVLSSYYFSYSDQGPPNKGASSNYATTSPSFNSQDKTCEPVSGWVCEHRWFAIRGMAKFRSEAAQAAIDNVYTEENRIAFGRVGTGYFVLNNGDTSWTYKATTSLPAGAYCDVWSGELQNGQCTGEIVNVAADGSAKFVVPKRQFMAVHTGWKV